jgi:putative (di)nucleoside polyphosphate hydrolase
MTITPPSIPEAARYRPCVGIALFNRAGLVFVGHRIGLGRDPHWQMPQGGIDHGETPQAAASRELVEETGTALARIVGEIEDWLSYDLPGALKGNYRGQRQKWFAMRFEGRNSDFNLNTAHPEFDAWKWVPLADAVGLIIDFKRPVYERVAAEFAAFAVPCE